jgi:beta-aspartyl-peptidase (threonine type)
MTDQHRQAALAIHGGAGRVPEARLKQPYRGAYEEALTEALNAGWKILDAGAPAIEAVAEAVSVLEDRDVFNAGRGAALCSDGSVELSASLMDGGDLSCGAVAGLAHTKNPVLAARKLLGRRHWFLGGPPADRFAEANGLEQKTQDHFVTDDRQQQLAAFAGRDESGLDHSWTLSEDQPQDRTQKRTHERPLDQPGGTVGAVARDRNGALAAATSTGGMANQPPGRIGDTPVIGAGTWAQNNVCAISTTGSGEYFLRTGFARRVADLISIGGADPDNAATQALGELAALGGEGGCIVVDGRGTIYLPFNTDQMFRGWVSDSLPASVAILADDARPI